MADEITRLMGNEWQEWADQLLSRHYGPTEYQKIPAKDGGDAGIEGFTVTSGHAYQCYGCDEPVSVDDRYTHQRNKMTTDIGKFIRNDKKLKAVLGPTLIRRWCLFVPVYDSRRIVEHANTKTAEVKAAKLPYVAPGFRVIVTEEKDFAKERDELTNLRPNAIEVSNDPTREDELADWASKNDPLIAQIDGKVARLPTIRDGARRLVFRNEMIRHYLDGQNVLRALQTTYPIAYERVVRIKYEKERYLKTASMVATGNPSEILKNTVADLRQAVDEGRCGVASGTADAVAYGAVAEWMLRCPLDFPEESGS